MINYLVIRPATGEMMGQDRYGLVVVDPKAEQPPLSPKLMPHVHIAENHQSAMNCEHGSGWEVATVDLLKGIVSVSVTESAD